MTKLLNANTNITHQSVNESGGQNIAAKFNCYASFHYIHSLYNFDALRCTSSHFIIALWQSESNCKALSTPNLRWNPEFWVSIPDNQNKFLPVDLGRKMLNIHGPCLWTALHAHNEGKKYNPAYCWHCHTAMKPGVLLVTLYESCQSCFSLGIMTWTAFPLDVSVSGSCFIFLQFKSTMELSISHFSDLKRQFPHAWGKNV